MIIKNTENIILENNSYRIISKLFSYREKSNLTREKGGVILGTRKESNLIHITGKKVYYDEYKTIISLPNLSKNPSIYVCNDNLIIWLTENIKKFKNYRILAYYHFHLSNNPIPSLSDEKQMKKNVQKLKRDLLMFIFADKSNNTVRSFKYIADDK